MKLTHILPLALCNMLLGVLLSPLQSEAATSYTFTNIADTSGGFSAFGGEPSINSAGTVAFHGEFDGGGEGVFRGSGVSITTIADSSGPLSGFGGITSINASGTVAFRATIDGGGDGIFSGHGGQITTIADGTGPFASFITDGPWINDNGTVAFFATLDTGDEGIFTGSGGAITTIADASGGFTSFGIYPSINSADVVAFFAAFDAGGEGIITGNGGPLTTIADTFGPFASFDTRRLSIDDQGVVTFAAMLDAGGGGWFRGNSGSISHIPDPEATFRAIVQSSPLFSGATVLHAPFQGMNASGQYVFFARFADGTETIYRADPVVKVNIDIKPGSATNCFNNNARGVIPIAILSSADFDATQVDPGTVQLAGLAVKVAGKSNKYLAHTEDINSDGLIDLVVQIEDTDRVFTTGTTTATLTGVLFAQYGNTPIEGTDDICIVP